ncbi:MAG: hypothetical protein HGB12_16930 [Bacteroidetes bacterium]|nr:hypothetical protein [Bacteroidota bacterium]
MNATEITQELIKQLGDNKFLMMTGCKKLMFADVTETNKNYWLRMNLMQNKSGANRLKIFLMGDDTYTMKFYHQTINKNFDCIITKEQTFEGVYHDMLQNIFTKVTGLYTKLF